jgi:hypothetical protein
LVQALTQKPGTPPLSIDVQPAKPLAGTPGITVHNLKSVNTIIAERVGDIRLGKDEKDDEDR